MATSAVEQRTRHLSESIGVQKWPGVHRWSEDDSGPMGCWSDRWISGAHWNLLQLNFLHIDCYRIMLEKSEQIVGECSWSLLSSFFLPLKSQKDAQSIRYHICSLRSQRCTWPSSQLVNEGSTLIGTQPLQLIWDLYRHLSNLLCSFPSLHSALCSSTVEQGLMMWNLCG